MEQKVQGQSGYEKPEKAGDAIVAKSRQKHNLGEEVSMAEIEPVAKELLGSPLTSLEAAQLVLNRRVDAKEKMIAEMLITPGLSADDKFAMLLMEKTVETSMKNKGMTDFGTKSSLRG
jgi:hypothetical protein